MTVDPTRFRAICAHQKRLEPLRELTSSLIEKGISEVPDRDKDLFSELGGQQISDDTRQLAARLAREARERHDGRIWEYQWNVRRACNEAYEAYGRLMEGGVDFPSVLGLEEGAKLREWIAAHEVLASRESAEKLGVGDFVESDEALRSLERLRGDMAALAARYDRVAAGDAPVSGLFPKAALFAIMPELRDQSLPDFLDGLADRIENAEEGMLLGLFHPRWLESETDLRRFVSLLRRDAERVRDGSIFGPTRSGDGWRQQGTDSRQDYVRYDRTNENWGLVPTFVWTLAMMVVDRDTFVAAGVPEQIPRFGTGSAGVTVRADRLDDGTTRLVIG